MPDATSVTAVIFVLAGINGAGKSSVAGARIREQGKTYFNPDEATRRIQQTTGCSEEEANSLAWQEGKEMLESAIRNRTDHSFESTLGGNTIPKLLEKAAQSGLDVRVWYVGLGSVEQHMARIRARVAAGGHDIPEEKIRERWDGSRRNIIALMPYLTELRVFDNSREGDAAAGTFPAPKLLLHWSNGAIVAPSADALQRTPEWAKPIIGRALKLQRTMP